MIVLEYLASPYSHEDPHVRHKRLVNVSIVAGKLFLSGRHVYSPIVHNCGIIQHLPQGLFPNQFEGWQRFDEHMLRLSGKMLVLMLDGWENSRGVNSEIDFARRLNLDISYIKMSDFEYED